MNDGHGDVRRHIMKCKLWHSCHCHVSFLEQEVANFILNSKLTTKLVLLAGFLNCNAQTSLVSSDK